MKKLRAAGAVALGSIVLLRLNRRWFPVRVSGESMLPTLTPGDFLAVRSLRPAEPLLGQIVVVNDTERETVKRVVPAPAGDEPGLWVEGDNRAASTDSRTFGPVARAQIVGVVRARYRPLRRARLFA